MSKLTELSFISPKRLSLDTILLQRTVLTRNHLVNENSNLQLSLNFERIF